MQASLYKGRHLPVISIRAIACRQFILDLDRDERMDRLMNSWIDEWVGECVDGGWVGGGGMGGWWIC